MSNVHNSRVLQDGNAACFSCFTASGQGCRPGLTTEPIASLPSGPFITPRRKPLTWAPRVSSLAQPKASGISQGGGITGFAASGMNPPSSLRWATLRCRRNDLPAHRLRDWFPSDHYGRSHRRCEMSWCPERRVSLDWVSAIGQLLHNDARPTQRAEGDRCQIDRRDNRFITIEISSAPDAMTAFTICSISLTRGAMLAKSAVSIRRYFLPLTTLIRTGRRCEG
jgi:hypothetical protein